MTPFLRVLLCKPMLDPQDLKEIKSVASSSLDDFAGVVNRSLLETEKRLGAKIDAVDQRIDKLYSLVDGFVSLHQKLDQELTMLRARMDRMEQEFKLLQSQAVH